MTPRLRFLSHFICIFLATALDVRVHASDHSAKSDAHHGAEEPVAKHADEHKSAHEAKHAEAPHGVAATRVELPRHCAKGDSRCAIFAENGVEVLDMAEAEVRFGPGTSLIRVDDHTVRLIRGVLRVHAREVAFKVETLYGSVKVDDGQVLFEASDARVKFTNISGQVSYAPRGEARSHDLPRGYSTAFSKVTKTGVADTAYPHPAEIDPLLKSWSQVYRRGEKSRFAEDLRSFLTAWRDASASVGPWYLDTVQREIATAQAEKDRLARLKAQREREDSRYRNMLRDRVFGE